MLTTQGLMRIKAKALRQKVWYNSTSRLERGIVELTRRCVDRIRSPVLTRIISGIITKIAKTLENRFLSKVQTVGSKIAESVCRIALGWGNVTASGWKHDPGFVKFLGNNAVNSRVFCACEGHTV